MRPGLAIPFHFVIFEETRGAADESQWPRSFLGTPDRDLGFLFSHRVQTARALPKPQPFPWGWGFC